jgi:hypothetical protein
MRGQFIGVDVFEDLKVFVIFTGYDGFDIGFIILWFQQGSVDSIEGWGKLFNIAIMFVGIVDDMPEHHGRDGIDLVAPLWCKSFDWARGYYGIVREVSR